jgi:hypothetical protein
MDNGTESMKGLMVGSVCFQRALNLDGLKAGTTAYKGSRVSISCLARVSSK